MHKLSAGRCFPAVVHVAIKNTRRLSQSSAQPQLSASTLCDVLTLRVATTKASLTAGRSDMCWPRLCLARTTSLKGGLRPDSSASLLSVTARSGSITRPRCSQQQQHTGDQRGVSNTCQLCVVNTSRLSAHAAHLGKTHRPWQQTSSAPLCCFASQQQPNALPSPA